MERTAVFASAKTKGSGFCNDERPLVAPPNSGGADRILRFCKDHPFLGWSFFVLSGNTVKFFVPYFQKNIIVLQ